MISHSKIISTNLNTLHNQMVYLFYISIINYLNYYNNRFFLDIFNKILKVNDNEIIIIFDNNNNLWFGLIDIVKEYYDEGHCTFIFGEKRSVLKEFGEKIKAELGLDSLMPEDENQIKDIMGGATDDDVRTAVNSSRIILTTYQYGSKGLSIGKMTRGIQLTSRRHGMKQVCGRLTRADGDVNIPRIWVDIRDCNTSLASQKKERNQDYREKGYEIEEEEISYEDIKL